MPSPYLIDGPAVISFSGGRTSAFMLRKILDAYDDALPGDVRVVFANTGKEMPETLDFVSDCARWWGVEIVWVEYRSCRPREFAVVTHETASRNGEPFALAIKHRSFLPNPIARFCTVETKILTIEAYCKSLGWEEWDVAVGIRDDEPRRAAKIMANPSGGRGAQTRIMPLVEAGVTAGDVGRFWREQPFDLRLPNINGVTKHGNCDLCYLKGPKQVLSLIREAPERAVWWMEQEKLIGGTFRADRPSYSEMHKIATTQGEMFDYDAPTIEDCFCTD